MTISGGCTVTVDTAAAALSLRPDRRWYPRSGELVDYSKHALRSPGQKHLAIRHRYRRKLPTGVDLPGPESLLRPG